MTITLTREEAQQVLDVLNDVRYRIEFGQMNLSDDTDAAIDTLRTRLAQPEPEPVAWIKKDRSSIEVSIMSAEYMRNEGFEPLYTAAPQRVYCSCGDGIVPEDGALCGTCVSLKKMREWQGLTAYEIQEIHLSNPNWGNFACAIEAKLKEKNS